MIKTASLSYDENRKAYDGEYAQIFKEEYDRIYWGNYNQLDEEYRKYLDSLQGKKVHSGYFSIDKKNQEEYHPVFLLIAFSRKP